MTTRKQIIIVQFDFCPPSRWYFSMLSTTSYMNISTYQRLLCNNLTVNVHFGWKTPPAFWLLTYLIEYFMMQATKNWQLTWIIWMYLSKEFDTLLWYTFCEMTYVITSSLAHPLSSLWVICDKEPDVSKSMVYSYQKRIHLGPLLLLIHNNDLPLAAEYATSILYTAVTASFHNVQNDIL